MGIFKDRSNFFKQRAIDNMKIAHTHDLGDGEVRNSFFRLNDEEELLSGTVNFIHLPCLVHFGFDGRYTSNIGAVAKRKLSNELIVLSKADTANMDGIENAYDEAFQVLEEILSWMQHEFDTQGSCGPFSVFDLSRCSFTRYKLNENIVGWLLSFEDEVYANEVNKFDATKWFE